MTDGKTVLVIDDDVDVLNMMSIFLRDNNCRIVAAANAADGLKKYKQSSPDLIFVDLMMEEVDSGIKFLKELKILGNDKPVFMMTSVGDSMSNNVDLSKFSLAGVLQKPVSKSMIEKILTEKLT